MLINSENKIKQLENQVDQLRSAVEELTVLNDLAIAASSSLQVDRVLDTIVEKSIKALKGEQGSILLVTDQRDNPLQTLIRQADRHSRMMKYRVGTHITGWVLKNQAPLLVENLSTDPRFQTTDQEKQEIRTLLGVPIQSQGKILGIITIINKKDSAPFSQGDLRLLSIIAAQSGQLIRNLQLQQETREKERMALELATARKIQQDLLPKIMPEISNLEIASFFNPADEVGGDYFDFLFLENNQLGIVMADVSGHGASAAMIMTMVKGILHSIFQHSPTVDQALSQVNKIVLGAAPPDTFVTMALMVYDPALRTLEFSNAGHNPPLYYQHQDGSVNTLELPGCALNCLPDASYSTERIALQDEDFVFLYTDGLSEATDRSLQMFGYERLKSTLNNKGDLSAGQIVDHVRKELASFCGDTKQADDIAMIALKARKQN